MVNNLNHYGAHLQKNKELNSLIANRTKWSNTLKQFVCNLPTNCFGVLDHFVILALKGLKLNALL